ncbi:hypothetical protein QA641_12870 [Bradyrhizobium sp. CB1650]|uniref:hypothetical protein n=1 Tax=Bradyrhizobium sp. CB1650 TaxID=3039153 RepID=UPI0024357534|nr:hypothetical protein [Bradyrhizobium sp. CB1650]WGD54717.1 hypothetical protein QA641_12870 [Bradyrhizobium sp. CB1650]
MLSRLIALLRRLPAVQWAFGRLRPAPQVDAASAAPAALEHRPAAVVDITEATPAACADAGIGNEPSHDITPDVAPVAVESATIADLADEASRGCTDVDTGSSSTTLADVEPVIADDAPVVVVETSDQSDAPVVTVTDDPSHSGAEKIEPVAANAPAVVEIAESSPAALVDSAGDESSCSAAGDVEPVAIDASPVAAIELAEDIQADRPDVDISNDTAEIEAVTVESAPTASVEAVEPPSAATASVTSSSEPPAACVSPAAETGDVPKNPVKAAEPVDRATLIRQRWAETGIRMWNPRLHGTGEAPLNIQGRIELLPPAPGEKMPRYDKLEFRMLGGQIVCEGVVVDAPVHAGQRSFTVLAERRHPERAREASAERQAVLA